MQCPKCGRPTTSVIDSRTVDETKNRWRRRQCTRCEYRFSTIEVPQPQFKAMEKAITVVANAYDQMKRLQGSSPGLFNIKRKPIKELTHAQ